MTRDEALYRVKGYLTDIIPVENYSEVEEIIKVLEQEPREDCISRQAAIKNAHLPVIDDAGYEVVRVDDILALPSAEPKKGWIPVSERLPENSGCVLISIAGDIEFGAYDRQNSDWAIWRDGYWDEGKRADAWMPLPEPYKAENKDKE